MTDNPADNQSSQQQQQQVTTPPQRSVDRVAFKAPPFWKTDPNLWFIQLEAQFQIAGITQDTTKYNYVLSAVDTEILSQVTDYITAPPSTNKYQGIRNKLTGIYADSNEKNLRKLLSDIDLGDRKPSQLLNEMTRLGGTAVSSELLKTLWMARLPAHMQSILTTSSDPLQNLAQMADKIAEIERPRVYAATMEPRNDDIAGAIQKLTLEVAELKSTMNGNARRVRPRSRTPARYDYRSPIRSRDGNSSICWYHRVFKEKAKKCYSPCEHFRTTSAPAENAVPRQ